MGSGCYQDVVELDSVTVSYTISYSQFQRTQLSASSVWLLSRTCPSVHPAMSSVYDALIHRRAGHLPSLKKSLAAMPAPAQCEFLREVHGMSPRQWTVLLLLLYTPDWSPPARSAAAALEANPKVENWSVSYYSCCCQHYQQCSQFNLVSTRSARSP